VDRRLLRQNSFEVVPKLLGVASEINHAKRLRGRGHFLGQYWPIESFACFRQVIIHPAQLAEQIVRFRGDLGAARAGRNRRRARAFAEGGLRGELNTKLVP